MRASVPLPEAKPAAAGATTGANGRLARLAMPLLVAATSFIAFARLSGSYLHLIRPWSGDGGWDLKLRWLEVHAWFSGQPVYGAIEHADYPPASYPLLWPAVGWTNMLHSRWLWAASTFCAILWLSWTLARESGARSRLGLLWFALLPGASYATFVCLLTGQLTFHVLALLTAGLLVLVRRNSWRTDLLGSAAVVARTSRRTCRRARTSTPSSGRKPKGVAVATA